MSQTGVIGDQPDVTTVSGGYIYKDKHGRLKVKVLVRYGDGSCGWNTYNYEDVKDRPDYRE